MTAAELIAKLSQLPGDTIIAVPDAGAYHHVSRTCLIPDQWGVACIEASPRVVTEEDVS